MVESGSSNPSGFFGSYEGNGIIAHSNEDFIVCRVFLAKHQRRKMSSVISDNPVDFGGPWESDASNTSVVYIVNEIRWETRFVILTI